MASKTTQSANDVMNYMARNAAPSWDGATTLYASLHTGAVGLGGDQTTNEVAYTGYGRIALLRNNSTGEFTTAVGGSASNQNLLQFGNATAGTFPITATHIAIGENGAGAGTVIATGALTSQYTFNSNTNPQVPVGNLIWQEQ
jgi:hypothetical protein